MKVYRVLVTSSTYDHFIIEANSEEEVREKAIVDFFHRVKVTPTVEIHLEENEELIGGIRR